MALPALTLREKILYKDKFTAYVPVPASDGSMNIIGWTIAPFTALDATPLQNVSCNLHLTPNFDLVRGMAGLTKEVNIDTSNLMTFQRQIQIPAACRIYAVTRYGDSYWFKQQGATESEVLVACSCVYLVPDKAPDVII
jgi:hypothetical protein